MLLFAIKDVKIGFKSPFARQNKEVAIRDFRNAVSEKNSNNYLSLNPEDFELWYIGSYDETTGIIKSELEPLCSALEAYE